MKSIKNISSPGRNKLASLEKYFNNGRLNEAEKLAISLTQKFPKHQFAWKVLGIVLNQRGRITESLIPCQKAVQLAPHDVDAHYNLGVTFEALDRLKESEASLLQAIALKPDFAEAHADLGNTLRQMGRLEDAEAALTQAIALKPGFAEAHADLGNTLKEMGRFKEAEAALVQAIALKPGFAEAINNLGVVHTAMGKLEMAEAHLRKAITLKPNSEKAHNNLGVTLREMGRSNEAETTFRQAVALNPNFDEAHINLGITLREMGRFEESAESYKQVIALNPNNLSAYHMLAAVTGETTASAPRHYVEELFDDYAERFENSLVEVLDYKIPKIVADIMKNYEDHDSSCAVLDLGCGTGLFGEEIRQHCDYLEGVDLSEKMLSEARRKNVYDKLTREDIVDFISDKTLNFDYFVSTDVFVYMGDLSGLFRLIKSRNKKSGKLVFSTENYNGEGFFLENTGRYSHSKSYIEGLCREFGYGIRHFETHRIRKDKQQYIKGGLYVLEF